MTAPSRESQLSSSFITLADTLVEDYDIVDFLQTLVEETTAVLDAADAGILIPDGDGNLQVIASTSDRSQQASQMQLEAGEGPSIDAFRSGRIVAVDDIAITYARWPSFATAGAPMTYRAMYAIPLRLREKTIGSLNLYTDRPGPMDEKDTDLARAFADVATIGILQERAISESDIARQQLQRALDSRVVIEQAKGILAKTDGVDMVVAFNTLRSRARSSSRRLTDVAHDIVGEAVRS